MIASPEQCQNLGRQTFRFQGGRYKYFCHEYNKTYLCERAVEVPIIWEVVKRCKGRILEVGNVLSHYFPISHKVIDKYEKAKNILNVDVVDFAPSLKYDLIVSISTLEHVGWDEEPKDPEKILRAFERLKVLLNPGGVLLVTLPLGYNPTLDRILEKRGIEFTESHCLKRISKENHWRQVSWKEIRGAKYDFPFPFANAIVIGVWRKPKTMEKIGLEKFKNFLFLGSWFEREFRKGLKGRYSTFKTALNLFLQNKGKIIVETGTLRYKPKTPEFWSDGGSTYVFGRFCKEYSKHLYTVDVSRKTIAGSKKFTKEFKGHITYVTNDSIEFLRKFKGKIDLLYLDSLDCPLEGDATEAQMHQLNELMSAVSKLSSGAIILLDDNNFANGGKTQLAKEYLLHSGFTLLIDGQQALWIKSGWRANLFSRLIGWRDWICPYGTARREFYLRNLQPTIRRLASWVRASYNPTTQRKVFIDCSYVWEYGGNSGIQRVVRNIVNNCKSVGEKLGVECQPVVWSGSHFAPVEEVDLVGKRPLVAQEPSLETKPSLWQEFKEWLKRVLPEPVVNGIRIAKGAAISLARLVYRPIRRIRNELQFLGKRVLFKKGDILLLLDSSWHIPFWDGVRAVKKRGAIIGFGLYDLIPVTAPQFCDPPLVKHFRSWLKTAVTLADFCVAISKATKVEFERYLEDQGIDRPIKIATYHLGAELDWMKKGGFVREQVKDTFAGKSKPYIIVGTIEPRKNHEYLLEAFEKVWESGVKARLCIIGKTGWFVEDLVGRIAEHSWQGELLFMFNDLSDIELSFAYENAKALVTPSLCEGFNLPIVEALSEGIPVFASDIPIHRETCGEYCVYFDLKSPDNLARLIVDFEKKGQLPSTKSPKSFRWINWEESTEDLLKKVKHLAWGKG